MSVHYDPRTNVGDLIELYAENKLHFISHEITELTLKLSGWSHSIDTAAQYESLARRLELAAEGLRENATEMRRRASA